MVYRGERTEIALYRFILKKSRNVTQRVEPEELEEIRAKHDVVVAYFGANDSSNFEEYYEAARMEDQYKHVMLKRKYAKDFGLESAHGLMIFTSYNLTVNNSTFLLYEGEWQRQSIYSWMINSPLNPLFIVNNDNLRALDAGIKPTLVLFRKPKKNMHLAMESIMEDLPNKVENFYFAVTSGTSQAGKKLQAELGVFPSMYPAFLITGKANNGGRYKFLLEEKTETTTEKVLLAFIEQFKKESGRMKPYYKSQAPLKKEKGEYVLPLTGKEYRDKVLGVTDDVVV